VQFGAWNLERVMQSLGQCGLGGRVRQRRILARTPRAALSSHHLSLLEDLATPHTPRLTANNRPGEALLLERADPAERLCALNRHQILCEPELGIVASAWSADLECPDRLDLH
jgi:hypothetical protein